MGKWEDFISQGPVKWQKQDLNTGLAKSKTQSLLCVFQILKKIPYWDID